MSSTQETHTTPHDPLPPLSIEEKRQVLYSSLLRYRAEMIPLRERALNRVVMGALIGSTEEEPFRLGRIQENLRFGSNKPEIRNEMIQETLERLIAADAVRQTQLLKRHAYYLTERGKEDIGNVLMSSEELFNNVLRRMLRNTEGTVSYEVGAFVCRKFIFECFARFGQTIAKNVAGNLNHDALIRVTDVEAAFSAAIARSGLLQEAIESLRARCFSFLRSSEPDDEKLKFHLSQGYYFTQLLGLENRKFDPLNEQAFADATFFLDTNVLLEGILYTGDKSELFTEMVNIAKRIGIRLCVTRATINETRRVAADHLPLIRQIVEGIPEELAGRTDDQFLLGYLNAKEQDPSLTPDAFLAPFDSLPELLKDRWYIEVEDKTEDEILTGRDYTHTAEVVNEEAVEGRGRGKSEDVLNHDVCHYYLVMDERAAGRKAWFLTNDRTLTQAGGKLAGADASFCFMLIGFLHSISPFLTAGEEEGSFADVFSDFLAEQIFPIENVFDARELALMAELHEDVMSTQPDELIMAWDYVKTKTLQGKPYRRSDNPEVSLELKKFFSSSKEEQLRNLETERARLAKEKQAERERRSAAEEAARERAAEVAGLKGEVERIRTAGDERQAELQAEIDTANLRLATQQESQEREKQRRRSLYMVLGFAAGLALWNWAEPILAYLIGRYPAVEIWKAYAEVILKLVGAFIFSIPAFLFIRKTTLQLEYQITLYGVIIIAALAFSKILDPNTISLYSGYVDISLISAALIAIVMLLFSKKKE